MKIIVDGSSDQTKVTDIQVFNDIWKSLTKRIFSSKRFIRSIQVDGELYFNDFDIQILDRFDSIELIEIETYNETELLVETLAEIKGYLRRLLEAGDSIASVFYGDMDEKDWKLIAQFTEGLEWLYKAMTMSVDLILKTNENLELSVHLQSVIQKFIPLLGSMEKLLQDKEYIDIGDLLTYEMKPIFMELDKALDGNG